MVDIFTTFSGYKANPRLDKKLEEATEKRQDDDYDYLEEEEEEAAVAGEFEPIDHPAEPLEDDQPLKHPLPFSPVVNDEGELRKTFIENFSKMAEESPEENEVGLSRQISKHVDRSRRDYVPHSFLPSSNRNFFQVFQCKDFRA